MQQHDKVRYLDPEVSEWNPLSNAPKVEATGVGYSGLQGITWHMLGMGHREIPLPGYVFDRFAEFTHALKAYMHVIHRPHGGTLSALFDHKRPDDRVKPIVGKRPTMLFRPDVVLTRGSDGELSFKVTELESAPGGLGLFEAVRLAYDRPAEQGNIIDHLCRLVGDRPFVVVLTHTWIDYVWDICFACKLLRAHGIEVTVYIDQPQKDLEAYAAQSWKKRQAEMPQFTSQQPNWNPHLMERLRHYGFASFVEMVSDIPKALDKPAVVYRMGYHGSFTLTTIERLMAWERNGSLMLNGLHYGLESKANMAALSIPAVREKLTPSINRDVLNLLDMHIAKTHVVDPAFSDLNHVCDMHKGGVLKVAAWDPDDFLCWGAHGLVDGADQTKREWVGHVGTALARPYPIVVQERVESVRQNLREVCDRHGQRHKLAKARQRWTPMVLIDEDGQVHIDPGVITASSSFAAHGGVGSVMAPAKIEY
jgi:hypothetical protein